MWITCPSPHRMEFHDTPVTRRGRRQFLGGCLCCLISWGMLLVPLILRVVTSKYLRTIPVSRSFCRVEGRRALCTGAVLASSVWKSATLVGKASAADFVSCRTPQCSRFSYNRFNFTARHIRYHP